MKNMLAMLLALIFTTSIASAATTNSTAVNLKNAIKKDVTTAKEAIKKDLENADKEAKAKKEAQNKDKKAALKSKRDAQIAPIDNQIKTKKQQIKDVKKSATMTETEKNIRVRSYERQIEALEAKKERINKTYQTGIDAIK
ncbi:MAG: hypothetical protein OSJ27_06665 [Candidatus Gastranaerophilales bacterium]|nr:hypothetical protein [Candidatus Gastranaerophilales bacterium]